MVGAGAAMSLPTFVLDQPFAIGETVQRYDVTRADACGRVVGLRREVTGLVIGGDEHAHRAGAEFRHVLGRHGGAAGRFMRERAFEEVDGGGRIDRTLQPVVAEHYRHAAFPFCGVVRRVRPVIRA